MKNVLKTARRSIQLLLGASLIGAGLALCLAAGLGTDPIGVLIGGTANVTGLSFGTANAALGILVVAALWAIGGRRPGIGTVTQPVVAGASVDLLMGTIPAAENVLTGALMLAAGILVVAAGAATYLGARLGEGPFDGIPLEMARRTRLDISRAYLLFLPTAFTTGMLLGGPWGVGSLIAAAVTGPIIGALLPHLATPEEETTEADLLPYTLRRT